QSSRMKSASVLRGSMNARRTEPLTLTLTRTSTLLGASGTGGLLECAADGSGDHLDSHPLAVPAAGVDVVRWIEALGLGFGHLSESVETAVGGRAGQGGLHRRRLERRAAHPEQADARPGDLAAAVELDGGSRPRQR